MVVLRTFVVDETLYEKFKEVCARERTQISTKLQELIENYVKIHGEGNPVYTLQKWIENEKFSAVPALLEDFDKIQNWLIKNQKDTKTIRQIQTKIQEWEQLIKNWDYGRLPRHQSNS